jgi:hypothetical protein
MAVLTASVTESATAPTIVLFFLRAISFSQKVPAPQTQAISKGCTQRS